MSWLITVYTVSHNNRHVLRECKLRQGRCSVALWWVTIYTIKYPFRKVKESEKMIVDPHPISDQHQNLTTSRWSPHAHAYHVWSTCVNAFVSYPAHSPSDGQTNRMNERQTNNNDRISPPWQNKYQLNQFTSSLADREPDSERHADHVYRHRNSTITAPPWQSKM